MSAATTTASLEEVEALVEQEPLIGLTLLTILVFLVSAVFYVSMVQSTIGPDDYDDLDPAVVEHHNWLQTREEEQERAEWQAEFRRREAAEVLRAQRRFIAKQRKTGAAILRKRAREKRSVEAKQREMVRGAEAAAEGAARDDLAGLDDDVFDPDSERRVFVAELMSKSS